MICRICSTAADNDVPHDGCRGGTWCDCQHERVVKPEVDQVLEPREAR